MSRRDRRIRLWKAGNRSCPICLYEFSFERDINIKGDRHAKCAEIEHVPPKGMHGQKVLRVLTCASCNAAAGKTVDHSLIDMVKGEHEGLIIVGDKRTPVRLSRDAPSREQRDEADDTDNQMDHTTGDDRAREHPILITMSHPATPDQVHIWSKSHLLPKVTGTKRIQLQWKQRPNPEVGLLKSAYLALYSILGTQYARDPALTPVRTQIQQPHATILSDYTFKISPGDRSICIAYTQPRCCWAVSLDGYLALLPGAGDTSWPGHCFDINDLQKIDYKCLSNAFSARSHEIQVDEIPISETDTDVRRGIRQVGPLGWEIREARDNKCRTFVSVGGDENKLRVVRTVRRFL